MNLIENFWLVLIAVNFINGFVMWRRAQEYIKENPDLRPGYLQIIKGFILFASIPWLVMGLGQITGMTKSLFQYFSPAAMNPFVLLFHFSLIMIWALGSFWIFGWGGADKLASHPGIIQMRGLGMSKNIDSSTTIKFFWGAVTLGGLVAEIIMWLGEIPTF